MNANTSVIKIGEIPFIQLVFEIWCPQGFQWDAQTHSRMDRPKYRRPLAPFLQYRWHKIALNIIKVPGKMSAKT